MRKLMAAATITTAVLFSSLGMASAATTNCGTAPIPPAHGFTSYQQGADFFAASRAYYMCTSH